MKTAVQLLAFFVMSHLLVGFIPNIDQAVASTAINLTFLQISIFSLIRQVLYEN